MMPINLTLSAFGPYQDTITINFETFKEDGLFLITGPTGSGKTMIFDAMIFALYGKTSGKMRESDSLRCDHAAIETPTYVELSFSLHDQIYYIKRNPRYTLPNKKTAKQPSASLTLPDGKIIEGVKEVNTKVISLLGIDEQQFKQIVMIAQGEFTQLIMASSDEREKVLRDLFHSEIYQNLEEKLKTNLKVYQDKYDLLLNKRKDYQEELNLDIPYQDYLINKTKEINDIQIKQQETNKQLESLKQQKQLYVIQNQRIKQLTTLKEQQKQLIKQELTYNKLANTIQQLKKAKDTNYLYQQLKQQENKLKQLKIQENNYQTKYQEIQTKYQTINNQYNQLSNKQKQKDTIQLEIENTKQKISTILQYQHYYQNLQTLKQQHHQLEEEHKLFLKTKEKKQTTIKRDEERINLEKQIETDTKLLQQQYETINNRKIKIHQLSDKYQERIQELEQKTEYQENYEEIEKEVEKVKKDYFLLEQQYFRQQAGIFASKLKDNEPCPICGSLHHPSPAKLEKEDVSKEKLDKQKEVVAKIEQKQQEVIQKILLQKQKIEQITKQIDSITKELELDETINKDSFIKLLSSISNKEKELNKRYQENNDELKYIQKLKKSVELSKKDMIQLEDKQQKQEYQLEQLNIQIHQLSGKLDTNNQNEDINELKEKQNILTNKQLALTKEITDIQEEYNSLKSYYIELQTQINSCKQNYQEETNCLQELKNNYQKQLLNFTSEEEFINLIKELDSLNTKEKDYQEYLLNKQTLTNQINSLEKEVKDTKEVDITTITIQITNLTTINNQQLDILQKAKIEYSLKDKLIKQIENINQTLEKDEAIYQRYLDLYNVTSGKNNARVSLERYVLATYFEHMLIYANRIFKQLTQGRYQLIRKDEAEKGRKQQGLELNVFDQESGALRGIKTLSGGESFKAALSLSLGLSQMIQDYAGGIELNTLFIDEGFGSLDNQSLDQAMNCLMELHQDNKLIGIISHVSELKDRIERQIIVDRKQKQSKISLR